MLLYNPNQTQPPIEVRVGVARPDNEPGVDPPMIEPATDPDAAIPGNDGEELVSETDASPWTESTIDPEDEAMRQINVKLREANTLIAGFVTGEDPTWKVIGNRWIQYPTISMIDHATTHPAFLRTIKTDPLGLEGFKRTINGGVDFDIEADLRTVRQNREFQIEWDALVNLPEDRGESDVQIRLADLIKAIGRALGIRAYARLS